MEQTWVYFISLASIVVSLFLFKQKLTRRHKHLPPSPPSLPMIGHLHLMKEPVHRTLQSLSEKYGPIYLLWFGSRPVVVVSTPSLVEECFTKNDVVLANRPRFIVGKHLNYDYTTIGAASYGDLWRNLRRLATVEMLSAARLNMSLGIRQDEVQSLVRNLFNVSKQGFRKVEMKSRFSELSFNIIMRMVAGKRYFGRKVGDFEEANRFREIIRDIFELSGASNPGDFVPLLRWIDYQRTEKRMLAVREKVDSFLQGIIDEHRRNRKVSDDQHGEGSKTMIDGMLYLQESKPEYYSDEIIKGMILVMLTAGTDTSAATMEWAMSLLLNSPEVLKKATSEIETCIGQDHLVDEPDLSKLPHLQAIVNETLRLFPAAPLLVPHENSDNCVIGGFDVPRGAMLFVNAWAIHRDPSIWEDPTSFKPERFSNGGGEGEGYKLVPFGMGRRRCPGAGLANRVVGLALAALIQCFEWERVSEELVDMSEGRGLTTPKAQPLEALCKARPGMAHVLSRL